MSFHPDLDTLGVSLLSLNDFDTSEFQAHTIIKDSIAVKNRDI